MKAEDTVMSNGEIKRARFQCYCSEGFDASDRQVTGLANYIAKTQAEISFKAGIKEVIEWLKSVAVYELEGKFHICDDCKTCLIMPIEKWQAKLKKWGMG